MQQYLCERKNGYLRCSGIGRDVGKVQQVVKERRPSGRGLG